MRFVLPESDRVAGEKIPQEPVAARCALGFRMKGLVL